MEIISPKNDTTSNPLIEGEGVKEQNAREQNGNDVAEDHGGGKHESPKVFDNMVDDKLRGKIKEEKRREKKEKYSK